MDMYSGAGLENFDGGDLKGVVVDVMSAVGNLRSVYTQLVEFFAPVGSISDTEASRCSSPMTRCVRISIPCSVPSAGRCIWC